MILISYFKNPKPKGSYTRRYHRPLDPIPEGYYVYEWFRLSDGHVFYVGQGQKDRAVRIGDTHRNRFFLRFIDKYECDYRIIKSNLTQEEALILENEIYQQRHKNGECECNIADTSSCSGGSGLPGEKNGMWGKTHTPEVRQKLREINLGKTGATNCNARLCQLLDVNQNILMEFSTVTDLTKYLITITSPTYTFSTMRTYVDRVKNATDKLLFNKYYIKIFRKHNHDNTVPSSNNGEG